MRQRIIKRFVIGFIFALAAILLTATVGEADTPRQEGPVRTDCQECHGSVVDHWAESAHGQSVVDPIFLAAWEEKGSPTECLSCHTSEYNPETGEYSTEGIFCTTCHSGQTGPHPETPMPTDPSSRLCGNCHIDTYAEWQSSAHGEGELACVRCHNPHTTQLKVGNMHDLCTTCHNEEGHFYNYTGHAQQGLQCTDCHLRVSETPLGEGHGQRLHTFSVDLQTCNQCHGEEMHFPVPAGDESAQTTEMMQTAYAPLESTACPAGEGEPTSEMVAEEPAPQPVQPLNYLLVAAVGMGFGAAVTPIAENWFQRLTHKKDE